MSPARRLCALVATVGLLGLMASSASATTLPQNDFPSSCPTASSYGGMHICSGEVPSFDSAPLDVDVTQPARGTGTTHPLIIMLHGFGNNKHEWESTNDAGDGADKYHWNNHWFARHGYYVINYTARGFRDDGTDDSYQPNTPSGTSVSEPDGTIRLKSRDWEIRDTQWLAALVAATYPDVDPNQIAVTGGSYGGIESWLQASQAQWTFPHDQDSTLPELQLQVAVPKYPSTDLAYSLTPNGHGGGPDGTDLYESSQGQEDSDVGDGHPIGTGKLSYVTALYALGTTRGVFETGNSLPPPSCTYGDCEGPISIPAWQVRAAAGDPYDTCQEDPGWTDCYATEDAVVQQIRRGLTEFRGSYYQEEGWDAQENGDRRVAVFSIQGWTDDLFPAVESFRQFKSLKRRNSDWPIEVAVADVGHSRAQNRPETWHRLNNQAWQWLQSNIQGSHDQHTTVSSQQTVCGGATPAKDVTADTPEELANGTLTVHYPAGMTANPLSGGPDPNGPATDAIASEVIEPGEKCKHSDGPALGGYTAYSPPLKDETTTIGIGVVHVPYTAITGTTATLNVRLFDRASADNSKKCPTQQGSGPTQQTNSDQNQTTGDTSLGNGQAPGGPSDTSNNPTQGDTQPADGNSNTSGNTASADLKDGGPWLLRNLTDGTAQGGDQSGGGNGADNNDKAPDDDHAGHDTGHGDTTRQGGDQTTPTQDAATNVTSQTAGSNASGDSGQCELLISRGTYRINEPAGSGELDVPFYGNHWKLASGHQIRLDITQVDQPTYQPSKEPSAIAFDGVTLTLPTLESDNTTLEATAEQFPPTLLDPSKLPHKLAKFLMDAAGKVVGTINGKTGTVEDITGKGKDHSDTTQNADKTQLPSDVGGVVDAGGDGSDSGDAGDSADNGGDTSDTAGGDTSTGDHRDTGSKTPPDPKP
jgi:dienelactone hydrolase